MRVLANGDLQASALPVPFLVSYAYDVPLNSSLRLSGVRDWGETYDIEAKAPANAIPPGAPERDMRRLTQDMIRGLLADRFSLVMRVEQKTMPVYVLTVASGGPKLQKSGIAEKELRLRHEHAEQLPPLHLGTRPPSDRQGRRHGRHRPLHRELDGSAGGEPHGAERSVLCRDRGLETHAAAAASAGSRGRPGLRRSPHDLHRAGHARS
jgi:hypothetical protein